MEKLILAFVCLFMMACSTGPCSNVPQRPGAQAADSDDSETPSDAIKVFKDSGDKQCEAGSGMALEKMKEVLTKNKIKVYEAVTQSDGKMRMQVCGASAGQIHVFTISRDQVKRAVGLGFGLLK